MTDSSHPTPVRNDALVRRFLADTAIHSSIHVDTPSRQALLQRGVMVIPDVLDTLLDDTGGAHAMGLLAELTGVHPTLAPAEQGRMDVLRAWWLRWDAITGGCERVRPPNAPRQAQCRAAASGNSTSVLGSHGVSSRDGR